MTVARKRPDEEWPLVLEVPIRTRCLTNSRIHWAVKAKLLARQRRAVGLVFRNVRAKTRFARWLQSGGIRVTLARIAPSSGLDPDDNLRDSLKAVKDQVAAELGLPTDRTPLVTWDYEQRRGPPKLYAVEIRLEARP